MEKITYTNKVALNDVPSIADINKCKASDLNEIKNVVNTNADDAGNIIIVGNETEATEDTKLIIEEDDMNLDLQGSDFLNEYSESTEKGYSCDYTNKLHTYSTTEKRVGTWIDGKPIYRKIINFGALPNTTTKSVAHGISNLDEVILLNAIAKSGTSYKTIPDVVSTNDAQYMGQQIKISISSGNVVIYTETNQSSYSTYVTIEYTKTTD